MNSVIFNENKILKTKVGFMKDVKISIYQRVSTDHNNNHALNRNFI